MSNNEDHSFMPDGEIDQTQLSLKTHKSILPNFSSSKKEKIDLIK